MLSFIGSFGLFIIIGIPILALIAIPVYLYYQVLKIASKYTLTRFLIAWPLAIISAIVKGIGLIILTLVSFSVFVIALNLILTYIFDLSDEVLGMIFVIEFIMYLGFILSFIIIDAVTYFKAKEN
jgi:hypothetical protein